MSDIWSSRFTYKLFRLLIIFFSPWMAFQAGHAVVLVIAHFVVLIVHSRLAVLVTAQAGEAGIVPRVLVALGAAVPFARVGSGVDREVGGIVNPEISRTPAGGGGMAQGAFGGKPRSLVGRVGGIRIILTVAGIAFCRGVLKVSRGMAPAAILDVVPAGEREECVAESRPAPGIGVQFMADGTVGTEVSFHVVRIGRSLVIGHVTIDAFHPQGIEPEQGGGGMARGTLCGIMGPSQGEAALQVDVGDVGHQP